MGRKIGQNSLRSPLGGEQHDPAPGYRGNGEGALWLIGYYGFSWSSAVSETYGVFLGFNAQNLSPSGVNGRAHGFQLRCLSE